MVVAEDEDTLEYARRVLFTQRWEMPHDVRPAIPKEDQPCVRLKLLGSCDDSQCPYLHEGLTPVENPKRDYLQHPVGKSAILIKCLHRIGYTNKQECYLSLPSDRHPDKEILVFAESDEALEYAKKQLRVVMGRTYTNLYLSFCYVHPEGVEEPDLTLKFQRRRRQDYGIVKVDPTPSERPTPVYSPESFSHLDTDHIPSITSWLNAPTEEAVSYCQHMRVLRDYKSDVHKKLREGLEWMFENDLQPKLEGRFGKLYFSRILGDVRDSEGFDAHRLINYLFKHKGYKRFFHSEVAEGAPSNLSLLTDSGSTSVTYDMKLGVKGRGKLDVRLQFVDKKPKVVQVKKDENKILIFDVMCLNREHDMRVSLNSMEIESPNNPTVQNFLTTVTMPTDDTISFVPLGPDEEWTVRMLRHKTRKAFFLSRDESDIDVDERSQSKYLVTVSAVCEYELQREDLKSCDTTEVGPGDARGHIELELHNLNWEVAVGSQLGLTPEESLVLLIEPDKIPTDLLKAAKGIRWTPDIIMKDFEKDDFLQMMYNLNKAC